MPCTNSAALNSSNVTGTITATPGGLTVGGRITEVALNAATWTALPPTALAGRNQMSIQNISGLEIKINYNSFAALPVGYAGTTISSGSERHYSVTDSIVIYAKSASGTPTIQVEELA